MGIRGRDVRDDPLLGGAQPSAASTVALAPGFQPPPRDPLATVAITAEIPLVPLGAARAPAAPVRVAPRLPAPVPLRQTVWFLVFVLAVCGAGLWGLHSRPSWFVFLRNQVPPPVPVAATVTRPSSPAPAAKGGAPKPALASFHLATSSLQAGFVRDTYDVGSSDYSVTVTTTALCWVVIKSPANAVGDAVEATEPAGFHQTVPATNSTAFVEVAAHGATITISSAGHVLGTLADAAVGDYIFQP